MTILNAWVSPDRALVGVDSEVVCADGSRAACSKMIPLVHRRAVIACRGTLLFLTQLFNAFHMTPQPLDALLEDLPTALPIVFNQMLAAAPHYGLTDTSGLDGQTVVVVGWSPARARMIGWEFEQDDRARGFTAAELNPSHSAPWTAELPPTPDLSTPQGMAAYAKLQAGVLRKEVPTAAGGGEFIVASITRDDMQIVRACDL